MVSDSDSFTVHVAPYIDQLVAQYIPEPAPPVLTPADPNIRLSVLMGPEPTSDEFRFMQTVPYGSLVGSLSYIAVVARPDIARAVHSLQRAQNNPSRAHWQAALHVLHYLRSTPTLGPRYRRVADINELQLSAYIDASFAPDWKDADGISVTGYIIFLAGGPVAWTSHRQKHVAGSTCESEFIALSEGFNTIEWLRSFLNELSIPQRPTIVYEDNDAALKLAQGLSFTATSRHVVVRYSRVREVITDQLIQLQYVSTHNQLADGLTKILPTPNFLRHLPLILGFSSDEVHLSKEPYRQEYKTFVTSTLSSTV
jgi:hypothetical protein